MEAIGPRWDALLDRLAAERGIAAAPAPPADLAPARAPRHPLEPYAEVA
jgi:hypothetical protein